MWGNSFGLDGDFAETVSGLHRKKGSGDPFENSTSMIRACRSGPKARPLGRARGFTPRVLSSAFASKGPGRGSNEPLPSSQHIGSCDPMELACPGSSSDHLFDYLFRNLVCVFQLSLGIIRAKTRLQILQILTVFNLNALTMTETEEKLIAIAAIIGFSKIPKNGYKRPAAIGTPAAL